MGKLKTAAYALVALVVLSACLGGGDDGDNGNDVEENGEAEAEAAEEEETDRTDEEETDEGEEADETDGIETDEESDSGDSDAGADEAEEVDEVDEEEASEAEEAVEDEADDEQAAIQEAGPIVFESTVADSGIMVETVEERGDVLYVEYTTYETTEQGHANEIAILAGAYAGISGEGYQSDRMEVTVLGADGSEIGTFNADSDDATAYYNGEMTGEQYLQNVLNTLVA